MPLIASAVFLYVMYSVKPLYVVSSYLISCTVIFLIMMWVGLSVSSGENTVTEQLVLLRKNHKTGMDISAMSQALYDYTGGYPFLVSWLCKRLDEGELSWTLEGLRLSVRDLLKENNTLLDDVIKNIKNHPDFSDLIERIIICGAQVLFEIRNPLIDLGVMYGILKEQDGKVAVANVIFETVILNYFTSVRSTYLLTSSQYADKSQYIKDGHLDMTAVLQRFAAFMKAEYRDEDGSFIERQGRLLFLSFLRPIINGTAIMLWSRRHGVIPEWTFRFFMAVRK